MNIPSSTYRIQLSSAFTFKELREIIPYLDEMEISTIYASPIFQARKGSTHGYDVTDPLKINHEIGSLEELQEINKELKKRNISWLQDIVPNHMAYDSTNTWLYDVLEKGPASDFYEFFDINWESLNDELKGRIMAPFLGEDLEEIIQKGELTLQYDKDTFNFYYYDHKYPASIKSYPQIISIGLAILEKRYSGESHIYQELEKLADHIENFSPKDEPWRQQKKELHQLFEKDEDARDIILSAVETINSSRELFLDLLSHQYFQLLHWKKTEEKINYRRFFTINDLLCLKMEDQKVFDYYHQFIKQLCDEGLINGLRIDHIDGLFDPESYLSNLRTLVGHDQYIIIEKILEWEEVLPLQWLVQGTSGYGFLALINHLFTNPNGERAFTKAYQAISSNRQAYEQLIYNKKLFILKERMGGELSNLYTLMKDLNLLPADQTKGLWTEALAGFLAGFPVYRIYPKGYPLSDRQINIINEAHEVALKKLPAYQAELDYLRNIFIGNGEKPEKTTLFFLQRCQQFTGPLAAKGVEDTAFYIYNRLISHNEVGDSPHLFGVSSSAFHERMQQRKRYFPLSVNATATHDTKRGEDARMRINVLSEIPEEWFGHVEKWREMNEPLKKKTGVPDYNEEYFIYQSLIGALPQPNGNGSDFLERTKAYLQKVLREAKINTSWSEPDEEYEQDVFDFVASMLENDNFQKSLNTFNKKTAFFGAIYSLGQCLIKLTAPGLPDVYQGTELWDLSYVDPDNRRPVDYELRMRILQEIKQKNNESDYLRSLLENIVDGRIKMYTLYKGLKERRLNQKIFDEGEYIPLKISGTYHENVISYARRLHNEWYFVIVPRHITAICNGLNFPIGKDIWADTTISLPKEGPKTLTNIYTGEKLNASDQFYVYEALSQFPVAMLKG